MATFTYEQLNERLQALSIALSPDYLHGTLTGLACAGLAAATPAWQEELAGCAPDIDIDTHQTVFEALQGLCERALGSGEFDFQPLLPHEEEFLSVRAQSLAQWCDGFVQAYLGGRTMLDPDDREALDDLYAISQIEPDETYNNPEEAHSNETDFIELCEYVRMAVLSLYNARPTDAVTDTAPAGGNA